MVVQGCRVGLGQCSRADRKGGGRASSFENIHLGELLSCDVKKKVGAKGQPAMLTVSHL